MDAYEQELGASAGDMGKKQPNQGASTVIKETRSGNTPSSPPSPPNASTVREPIKEVVNILYRRDMAARQAQRDLLLDQLPECSVLDKRKDM
jgi:hypothetical protein